MQMPIAATAGNVAHEFSSEVRIVTPSEAARFLEANSFDRQRSLENRKVSLYANQMRRGEWDSDFTVDFGCVRRDDGSHTPFQIIDGQHRFAAQVKANICVRYEIRRFIFDSYRDLANRYGKIDIQRPRSVTDLARAHALDEEVDLRLDMTRRLIAAAGFIENDFVVTGKIFSQDEKLAQARRYAASCRAYLDSLIGLRHSMRTAMWRMATMSVGIAILDETRPVYGDTFVSEFWSGIVADDGLHRDDPRKVALDHIRDAAMFTREKKKRVSAPFSARFLANCWNAYTEGRPITTTRVHDARSPIRINGTRFRG